MKIKKMKIKAKAFGYKIVNKYTGTVFEKFPQFLPVKRIDENDRAIAFHHPKPCYEKHILIIPKKSIKNLSSLSNSELPYIQDCFKLVKTIIKKFNWEMKEYKLIVNGGKNQKIKQLHFHLIRSRKTKI